MTLQTKKLNLFTGGGEFTLGGENFTGDFYMIDGEAFDTQDRALQPTRNIQSEVYLSRFVEDRIISEFVSLPYNYDQLVLSYPDYNALNTSINRLFDNLIYIFTQTRLASTEIPTSYDRIFTYPLTGGDPKWQSPNLELYESQYFIVSASEGGDESTWDPLCSDVPEDFIAYSADVTYRSLSGYVIEGYEMFNEPVKIISEFDQRQNNFTINVIGKSSVIFISSDRDLATHSILLSSKYIDERSELEYENITDAVKVGDYIYMTDNGLGSLFKYEVQSLFSSDPIFGNARFLQKIQGSAALLSPSVKLYNPISIFSDNKDVYVFDSEDSSIKVFNLRLEYKQVIRRQIFQNHQIIRGAFDSNTSQFFLVYRHKDTNERGIIVTSDMKDFEIYTSADLNLVDPETNTLYELRDVVVSNENNNILYLVCDRDIFKKYISRIESNISSYYRNTLVSVWVPQEEINFYSASLDGVPLSGGVDSLFILDQNRLHRMYDQVNYQSLNSDDAIYIHNRSTVLLNEQEYNNAFNLNKRLWRLLNNTYQVINNVTKKPIVTITDDNEATLSSLENNFDVESFDLVNVPNNAFFIGENEIQQVEPINRCIRQIYNLQVAAVRFIDNYSGTITRTR